MVPPFEWQIYLVVTPIGWQIYLVVPPFGRPVVRENQTLGPFLKYKMDSNENFSCHSVISRFKCTKYQSLSDQCRVPLKTHSFSHSSLHIFFNSIHALKFLVLSYFVIPQLLKKIWAKSVHPVQNGGHYKIAPPIFSFINLKDICNFKEFSKNSNPHIFLIFEDINFIFCTVTHDNDLIQCLQLGPDFRTLVRIRTFLTKLVRIWSGI